MVRLSPEQTIILIRLIKKYDFLWNPESPSFKDKNKHEETYCKIGSYFKTTATEIKSKFRRIRGTYCLELEKLKHNGKTHSKLFYFDEIDFLRNTVSKRKRVRSQPTSEYETNDSIDSINEGEESIQTEYEGEQMIDVEEYCEKENPSHLDDRETDNQFANGPTFPVDSIENEVEANENFSIVDEANEGGSITSPNSNEDQTKDEFDYFGTYVASQLRKMDTISAMELMTEVQQLIAQKRINIEKQSKRLLIPNSIGLPNKKIKGER